ncbi:LOW QUALITY PROTEIN: olfactory receptor 14A16-like [Tachyglossus aculeatus]|uniref:LOW QUALITY PROTEIN: olfactory receptor 14A16-like n=1 Tax=Tachyglossus aculeatus TaxID=9261 RepID=UPI0018F6EB54|nr:LOW QUALITY PROTEIN: olfactory receptor 14A16-like [Tachyglossus aculeatus]
MTLLPGGGSRHHLPEMTNISTVTEFLLQGFSDIRELQLLHATLFLLVYLVALLGNLLIVAVTTLDQHLHTPMYFFLKNLSFIDLCYISTTVPKSIVNSLTSDRSISFLGCVSQLFLLVLFAASEFFLLTAMSYDRYAAICSPLRYELIMNKTACVCILAASWLSGGLFGILFSASTFSLTFCGSNAVQQFFCDVPPLLKISCSEVHIAIDVSVAAGSVLDAVCFIYIIHSYVFIFSAVLRMPSSEGRTKAFSTCLPHLTVITIFLFTTAFSYLKPTSDAPSALDLLVSMFYTVVPPTVNPLIYSLRNRDLKAALGRILRGHSPSIHAVTKCLCPGTNNPLPLLKRGIALGLNDIYHWPRGPKINGSFIFGEGDSRDNISLPRDSPSALDLVVSMIYSVVPPTISCSEDHIAIDVSVATVIVLDGIYFFFVIFSYVHIFSAVLRMPTSETSQAEDFGVGQDTRSHLS